MGRFHPAVTPFERRLASLENAPNHNEVGLSYHSQHEKAQESKPNVGCVVEDVDTRHQYEEVHGVRTGIDQAPDEMVKAAANNAKSTVAKMWIPRGLLK
jgi:hypothetical protein